MPKEEQDKTRTMFAVTITPKREFVNGETGEVIPIGGMDWKMATKASMSAARHQVARWVNTGHFPSVEEMKAGLTLVTSLDKAISAMSKLDEMPDHQQAGIQLALEML